MTDWTPDYSRYEPREDDYTATMMLIHEEEWHFLEDEDQLLAYCRRLEARARELEEVVRDATGPVVAWANHYKDMHNDDSIHPIHQELIDRLIEIVPEENTGDSNG